MSIEQKTGNRTNSIDYISLVDDMNDGAFQFCVDQLYSLWNYRVLQKEDVRRIDLKECLLRFNDIMFTNDEIEQGTLDYYLFILDKYFDSFLKCKKGSTAEKYRNRAMELLKSALSDNGTIEDVEDLVQIYVSLFRSQRDDFDKIENYVVVDLTFDVDKTDAEMLKEISEHPKLVPDGIVNKLFFLSLDDKDRIKKAIKIAYVNNVIFLCRCLQNRGAFATEEE